MSARDDELHRQAEQLAQQFESRGFIVTRQLEVEAAGLAAHLGVSEKTLRNWRTEAFGPPSSRTVRRVALYPLVDLARWQCAQLAGRSVLASETVSRSESAPGGTPP